MTQHAVRLEAPVTLVRLEEPVRRSRLRMLFSAEVETAGVGYRARLGFSRTGELGMVELRPLDPAGDCAAASQAISRQHGDPVSRRRAPAERLLWVDAGGDNLIEFRGDDVDCAIRMSPLPRRQPYLGG